MPNTYPGSGSGEGFELSGAAAVNEAIYRRMHMLFKLHSVGEVFDPNSALGQHIEEQLSDQKGQRIAGRHRLVVLSGLAHIHHCMESKAVAELEAEAALSEIASIMEEAPGA